MKLYTDAELEEMGKLARDCAPEKAQGNIKILKSLMKECFTYIDHCNRNIRVLEAKLKTESFDDL